MSVCHSKNSLVVDALVGDFFEPKVIIWYATLEHGEEGISNAEHDCNSYCALNE
jgi:hypothetical protein